MWGAKERKRSMESKEWRVIATHLAKGNLLFLKVQSSECVSCSLWVICLFSENCRRCGESVQARTGWRYSPRLQNSWNEKQDECAKIFNNRRLKWISDTRQDELTRNVVSLFPSLDVFVADFNRKKGG